MKKSDFRIGIYVHYKDMNLEIDDNHFDTVVRIEDYEAYSGIPITEKWLLKLGFEDVRENKDLDASFQIKIYTEADTEECLGMFFNCGGTWTMLYNDEYIRAIIYVHELQNMYWGLTGEQLAMKEAKKP